MRLALDILEGLNFARKNHHGVGPRRAAHVITCWRPINVDARHQNTPAMAIGVAEHGWSIGELIDAAERGARRVESALFQPTLCALPRYLDGL
jgi:hypothetical protein